MSVFLGLSLLTTNVHAQTSNNDFRRWLVDFTNLSTDVIVLSTSIASEYGPPTASSPETIYFTAADLAADTRLEIFLASDKVDDLTDRYRLLMGDVSPTSSNAYFINAVNAGQRAINHIRRPIWTLATGRIRADEWDAALQNFLIFSELSRTWQAIQDLSQR